MNQSDVPRRKTDGEPFFLNTARALVASAVRVFAKPTRWGLADLVSLPTDPDALRDQPENPSEDRT